jgi:hypothetical protein
MKENKRKKSGISSPKIFIKKSMEVKTKLGDEWLRGIYPGG